MPRKLKIVARLKTGPFFPNTIESFATEDAGTVSTEQLTDEPGWSLCCFDFERKQAIFAQTPEGSDITAAPFHYMAQYESAIDLASMPFSEFENIANGLPWPDTVVFVPNTGRCGSTLLSKAFAAVRGVLSISESDDLTQITFDLLSGAIDEQTAVAVARAAMKWQGGQVYRGAPVHCLVNKPRSEGTSISIVLGKAIPNLKILFMYRAADSWLQSAYNMYRAASNLDDPETVKRIQAYWSSFNPLASDYVKERGSLGLAESLVLNWCKHMENYLAAREAGLNCRALRYEDLIARPRQVLGQVFDFVGLTISDWAPILATFDRDAQEGSPLARAELEALGKPVPEQELAAAMEIVRSRPKLGSPQVILPGVES